MERLSTSRDAAEQKLLILYILSKLSMDISGIELTNYVLRERLMEYLPFQQYVHELVLAGRLSKSAHDGGGGNYYAISQAGIALLSGMGDLLPQTEKNRVDRTIAALNRMVIDERSVFADYTPIDEHNGVVCIHLMEGGKYAIKAEIAAASRDEARMMCAHWKERTTEIYEGIINLLLKAPK